MRELTEAQSCDLAIAAACELFVMDRDTLVGRQRTRAVAYPRQLVIHYLRNSGVRLETIGAALGGRHHTTITQAHQLIQGQRRIDEEVETAYQELADRVLALSYSSGKGAG